MQIAFMARQMNVDYADLLVSQRTLACPLSGLQDGHDPGTAQFAAAADAPDG